MVEVGVGVHVVELRLDFARTVVASGLRAGDGRLRLQRLADVVAHPLPVREFVVPEEVVEVLAELRRRLRELVEQRCLAVRVRDLVRGILLLQPFVPLPLQLVLERLRELLDAHVPARDDEAAVLVADFDHRDGRLVRVGVSGVLVHVREQVARVFLLKFNATRVELPDGLVRPRRTLRDSVAFVEGASHVEVHVHVDAALLEGGDQVVELVELRGGEVALRL